MKWYRLRISEENICGPKGEKKGENCVMSSFIIFTPHLILLGRSEQGRSDEQGMWHYGEKRNACRVLTGKPLGRRSLAESWRRLKY